MARTNPPQKFWQWIREQLDLLILMLAAAVFTIRSSIGVSSVTEMNSILLGFLTPLAYSQIRSRNQIASLRVFIKSRRTDLFLRDFPPDYYDRRKRMTCSYFFAGVSMYRTLPTLELELERLLLSGGKVRILLPNPDNRALLMMIVTTRSKGETIDDISEKIRGTLRHLHRLQDMGSLAIRFTETLPRLGINAIDVEQPDGLIMAQIYEFAARQEQAPIFTLTREDETWFEHYNGQIERLWSAGSSAAVEADTRRQQSPQP